MAGQSHPAIGSRGQPLVVTAELLEALTGGVPIHLV
jgi:hypothetical protein